mmetsp:Transcript_31905/g.72375  ORF Transcript_31905/g.72375 Transcript_31905/m.72375 type:complete len:230 (+) Transcript_31905:464-1153(+)
MMRVPPTRFAHLFMCSTCSVVRWRRPRAAWCSSMAFSSSRSVSSLALKISPPTPPAWWKVMPSVCPLTASNSCRSASRCTSASFTELLSCSCSWSRFRNLCTMSMTSVRPVTSRIFWNPSSVFCECSTCSMVVFCSWLLANFSIAQSFRSLPAESLNAWFAAPRATSFRHWSKRALRWLEASLRLSSPPITSRASVKAFRSSSMSTSKASSWFCLTTLSFFERSTSFLF